MLVGHTHVPLDRRANGVRIVNPGSVSLPRTRDDRARWALLTSTEDGYEVELRSTPYDLDRVLADLDHRRHPATPWLRAKMTAT